MKTKYIGPNQTIFKKEVLIPGKEYDFTEVEINILNKGKLTKIEILNDDIVEEEDLEVLVDEEESISKEEVETPETPKPKRTYKRKKK
ncbi:MAG: hypothetical protein ACR2MR_13590 [Dietzia maris]